MAPIHEYIRKGVPSHETGATGLYALYLRSTAYRVHDHGAAYRATGLQYLAWVLRKGGVMPERPGRTPGILFRPFFLMLRTARREKPKQFKT
jgi:hypothetical protein